jgi:hypothetical protein
VSALIIIKNFYILKYTRNSPFARLIFPNKLIPFLECMKKTYHDSVINAVLRVTIARAAKYQKMSDENLGSQAELWYLFSY